MGGSLRARLELSVAEKLGPALVRFLCGTQRWHEVMDEQTRERLERDEPVIYAFWHGGLLPLVYTHRHRGIVVLVSQNKDGELITRVLVRLGFDVVRGSSSRGGREALRELLALAKKGRSLGISPDGPRGPRREVQDGVIVLAALSGLPILPLAACARRFWQLRSWDRFEIPKPLGKAVVVSDSLVWVPRDARENLEHWRGVVQRALDEVSHRAAVLVREEPSPAPDASR